MIQVKWVHESKLFHNPLSARQIPVIPLAALTEVVEGLREAREIINDHAPGFTVWLEESEKILVQLEAHRKEG